MIFVLVLFILGLIIGSFLTALTDRWPKEIRLDKGRSQCPKCKKQIASYDNIPLFSYLLLGGKCRNCGKKISIRYPLIEFSTGILFALTYFRFEVIKQNILWLDLLPDYIAVAIVLIIISFAVAIFVIDFEYQYIPDRLIFWGLLLVIVAMLVGGYELLYVHMLTGLIASLFLLALNLATLGRGMGLGDVKLAFFVGMIFSYQLTLLWLFLSFVIGSIVGIGLLASKHAKLKQQIAFGPFLIVSMLLVIFCGSRMLSFFLPYIM